MLLSLQGGVLVGNLERQVSRRVRGTTLLRCSGRARQSLGAGIQEGQMLQQLVAGTSGCVLVPSEPH